MWRRNSERYREAGVKRIVALRGDLPATAHERRGAGRVSLRQRAGELHPREARRCIQDRSRRVSRDASAGRRGPARTSSNFRRKVEAGADAALTQLFYNADAYFDFMERCDEGRHQDSHRAGHHAHHELRQHPAFLLGLRRRPAALGAPAPGRACRTTSRALLDFGLSVVTRLCETLLRERRARTALLHHQSGRPHAAAVGESAVACARVTRWVLRLARPARGAPQSGLTLAWRQSTACRTIGCHSLRSTAA